MAGAVGAMAGRFATAEMRQGERAGKQVLGKMETTYQFEFALPESRSLGAFWARSSSYCNTTIREEQKQVLISNAKIGHQVDGLSSSVRW
jgi:hypothetical protein